jgi:hypothetical protein
MPSPADLPGSSAPRAKTGTQDAKHSSQDLKTGTKLLDEKGIALDL